MMVQKGVWKMEKIMQQKKFQSFLKGLHIIFTLLLIGASIAVAGILLLIGVIGVFPEDSIMRFLEKGDISATIHLYSLQFELSDNVISTFHFDKGFFLSLLIMYSGYLVVLWFIIFCVNRFLKSLKNGQIFTVQNSRYIEWVAYGFILFSLTIKTVQTFTFYSVDRFFNFSTLMQKSDWVQSITYDFFGIHWSLLFGGLIIWIIGRIFKYGAFLQEEYDLTA